MPQINHGRVETRLFGEYHMNVVTAIRPAFTPARRTFKADWYLH
jgi:hypothetical protein